MVKVHFVKSARKENKDSFTGEIINKGDSYYWWAFKFQPKKVSKTPPKQSQLTNSEFLQRIYEIQEKIEGMSATAEITNQLVTIKNEIEILKEDTDEKLGNIPDNLQNRQSAELLRSRTDSLQEWYDNLDDIAIDIDEKLDVEEKEQIYKDILGEIQNKRYEGE